MKYFLLILLSFPSYLTLGQDQTAQENLKDRMRTGGLSFNTGSLGVLYGFDNSKGSIEGTSYLNKDFRMANVFFYPRIIKTPQGQTRLDTIPNAPIRINIKDNDVEFIVGDPTASELATKVLPGTLIKSLTFLDGDKETLKNCSEFFADKSIKGFLRVLGEGKYNFYEYASIIVKQPDYNVAMNVGSKDTRILQDKKIMALKGKDLVITSSKKDFFEIFGDEAATAEKLMKTTNLSFKKADDVARLLSQMNKQ